MYAPYIISYLITVIFAILYEQKRTYGLYNGTDSHRQVLYTGKSEKTIFRIKKSTIYAFLSFFPLFLLSAFRYKVGTDFNMYTRIFKATIDGTLNTSWDSMSWDIGYTFLNKLISLFTDNSMWLYFFTSLITLSLIYITIYTESAIPWYSISIFFLTTYYFYSLNILRQFLAMSILLYSIKYIIERRKKKYIVLVLIATSMHLTSILFIPIYFVYNTKLYKYIIQKSPLVLCIMFAFQPLISKGIVKILSYTKYNIYFTMNRYNTGEFDYIWFLINLFIFLFAYIKKRRINNNNKYFLYLFFQILAVIVTIFSSVIPESFRVMFIFSFPQIILIPNALQIDSIKNNRQIIKLIVFIIYVILFILICYVKQWNDVTPYKYKFYQ